MVRGSSPGLPAMAVRSLCRAWGRSFDPRGSADARGLSPSYRIQPWEDVHRQKDAPSRRLRRSRTKWPGGTGAVGSISASWFVTGLTRPCASLTLPVRFVGARGELLEALRLLLRTLDRLRDGD